MYQQCIDPTHVDGAPRQERSMSAGHNLGVTFCAEQNPNGRILLWIGNMLGQVIDVEAKLPRMLRLKRSHLEIDGD
jgi:hypothetical protein